MPETIGPLVVADKRVIFVVIGRVEKPGTFVEERRTEVRRDVIGRNAGEQRFPLQHIVREESGSLRITIADSHEHAGLTVGDMVMPAVVQHGNTEVLRHAGKNIISEEIAAEPSMLHIVVCHITAEPCRCHKGAVGHDVHAAVYFAVSVVILFPAANLSDIHSDMLIHFFRIVLGDNDLGIQRPVIAGRHVISPVRSTCHFAPLRPETLVVLGEKFGIQPANGGEIDSGRLFRHLEIELAGIPIGYGDKFLRGIGYHSRRVSEMIFVKLVGLGFALSLGTVLRRGNAVSCNNGIYRNNGGNVQISGYWHSVLLFISLFRLEKVIMFNVLKLIDITQGKKD